jgi:hypothetical protein
MRKIKILLQVDRINWILNKSISYYRNFLPDESFYFLHDERLLPLETFKEYLSSKNFDESNQKFFTMYDVPSDFAKSMEYCTKFRNSIQPKLLEDNSVLLFPDLDEFIYHPNLIELLQTFELPYLIPEPIDVIHNKKWENKLNFDEPIFTQRKYCCSPDYGMINWYKKICIVRQYKEWVNGKETRESISPINNLYLIHIGKVDFDNMENLNIENCNMYPGVENSHNGWSGETLNNWFSQFEIQLIEIDPNLIESLKKINL